MKDLIQDVSDTSLWVAYFRGIESSRPNALFNDPYALRLVGERGPALSKASGPAGRFTQWSVVLRTVMIDEFINNLIKEGVDTILNLGAGMDSRPYRMDLPSSTRWIEVDFPHIIAHKENVLKDEKPNCQLRRISLDLSKRSERQKLFQEIGELSKKTVVLTEGVIPYLTPEEVDALACDLSNVPCFRYWIGEYLSPLTYKFLKDPKRMQFLKNAPFRFYPDDWVGFFAERGWVQKESVYYGELSEKLKRPSPMPLAFRIFARLMGERWVSQYKRMSGYILFERKSLQN